MCAARDPSTRSNHPHPGDLPGDLHTGLVIVNFGKQVLVEHTDGRLYRCVTRRNLKRVVCGDCVLWRDNDDDSGVVVAVQKRSTLLQRDTGARSPAPLAANLDQLIITCAPEPGIDAFLIDKYTVTAELAQLAPVIVLNKCDLLAAAELRTVEALLAGYRRTGYRCLLTSALCDTGMDEFRASLCDRTSILVGQSGVGKSSLIGRLLPDLDITVGRLSAASGLGRHTTTATTLYHLPGGGNLIDSPGVRDFHPGLVEPRELAQGFREFRGYAGQCRFSDCLHNGEPDCAVEAARRQGRIERQRLESYRRLLTRQS